MIFCKSDNEIATMAKGGKITADCLKLLADNIKPDISTMSLNKLAHDFIIKSKGVPSFLNYNNYPFSICISIDDEVVHGLASNKRFLKEGSIVSVDVGVLLEGYHTDAARSFIVGKADEKTEKLVTVCEECFFEGVKQFSIGNRIGDIGKAIETHANKYGYGVVRELCGHGIGKALHESPEVLNYYSVNGRGVRIEKGLVLAIEPMINMGARQVNFESDGWTVRTLDGKLSAHYENTVALTSEGIKILTL